MSAGIALSVVAPTRYLRDFALQARPGVHCLAAQRVLADRDYAAFYREQAEAGAELILDNGVFDLGRALAPADLVAAARRVGAGEIVLPDVLHDGAATLRATEAAARALGPGADGLRLCAVVQGRDDDDWRRCYDRLATRPYLAALAIPAPKVAGPAGSLPYDRVAATGYLADAGLVVPGLTYRLLGLGDSGHLELARQRRRGWLATVDSATPILLGARGVRIRPTEPYAKPPTRVEQIGEIPVRLHAVIRENIAILRDAAAGHLPPDGVE